MKPDHHALLFNDPPIAISPTLCRLISLQVAVFLQQVHYWLQHKASAPDRYRDDLIDGRYWVYWNYEQLQKAIPLGRSIEPHKRVIKELSSLGILLVEQHRASGWDRTNFYSIDYERFHEYLESLYKDEDSKSEGNPADREAETASIETVELGGSNSVISAAYKNTEITTETSSKNTTTAVVVGSENSLQVIHLLPGAERYRALIERSISGLNAVLAQEVADEVSGTIQAIELGRRKPVHGYARWIPALAERARNGVLAQQYGPDVARMRKVVKVHSRREKEISAEAEAAAHRRSLDAAMATSVLASLRDDDLLLVAKSASEKFTLPKMRADIVKEIVERRLPKGPGRVEAVEALIIMKTRVEATHGCHV